MSVNKIEKQYKEYTTDSLIKLVGEDFEIIDPLHKAVIDEYFVNGFDRGKAFLKFYPNTKQLSTCFYHMLSRSQAAAAYMELMWRWINTDLAQERQEMIVRIKKLEDLYNQLTDLALKEDLTDKELKRFNRIKQVISASDLNKSRDMIIKMLGLYAPTEIKADVRSITVNYVKPSGEPDSFDISINQEDNDI